MILLCPECGASVDIGDPWTALNTAICCAKCGADLKPEFDEDEDSATFWLTKIGE